MRGRLARLDDRLRRRGRIRHLAGVDEVGRGCLAGPVVVAAVILPPGRDLPGVDDSKRLTAAARERAAALVRREALAWAAFAVSPGEVDRRNVLAGSLWGMVRALERLRIPPELVLVDGHRLPEGLDLPARAIVRGDGRSLSVAAASVVAKVLRDRLMRAHDRRHPVYGFARNVGYPTPEHLRALREQGPCSLHRLSFAPVAQAAAQMRLPLASSESPSC